MLVNISAHSFTIRDNELGGSRRVKSAKLAFIKAKIIRLSRTLNVYEPTINVAASLTAALEARYPNTSWGVVASANNEFSSTRFPYFEYLEILYKGMTWEIYRL